MGLVGAWSCVGDSQIHIVHSPEGSDVGTMLGKLNPLAAHLALRVDDFDAARARFAEMGIEILDLGPMGDPFWVRAS